MELDRIITAVNQQKGELLALQVLTMALLRSLPLEQRARAFAEYDLEAELARTTLLNSGVEEELLASFEQTLGAVNALRVHRA